MKNTEFWFKRSGATGATVQKIAVIITLVVSITLTSCQQENLVTPDSQTAVSSASLRESAAPFTLAEKYILQQHGEAYLEYTNGKLTAVSRQYAFVNANRTEYVHSRGRDRSETQVRATVYAHGTDKLADYQTTYLIDPSTGLCFESTFQALVNKYSPANLDLKPKTWRYLYTANGQLSKKWNKANINEWVNYIYNVNDDLARVVTYSSSGTMIKDIRIDYSQPSGAPMKKNLYPLYIEAADYPDRYLKIFGKSSVHLLTHVSKKLISGVQDTGYEHTYQYTYNSDGYVTGESKYKQNETSFFEYQIFEY
jgi:hypothetical protein